VTLQSGVEEDDPFTRSIMKFVAGPFHRKIGQKMNMGQVIDKDSGYVTYRDAGIAKLTSIIVTVIAAVLPPLTILALNSLSTTNKRIGLTVLFTAVFAAILAYFSKAKRVEILVATAT
jgi:VIT1/CCC1 family predicted Fe2+/Mn2+ transporter